MKAISVATVVASLGTSLGVNVTDLIAAESKTPVRGEAVQHKTAMPLDWANMNASQIKLSEQIKMFESSQIKFWNQIKGESRQGKFDATQHKNWQANEHKLADQINNLKANEYKLSNQFKFLRSNVHKVNQADQVKLNGLEADELKLANQIKMLDANQHKLADQINSLQSKQLKY